MRVRSAPVQAAVSAVLAAIALAVALGPAHAQDGARRDEGVREEPVTAPAMTKPPVLLEAVAPAYPPAAAEAGLEAVVKVRLSIDATGAVTRVEVVTPVGSGFDEAAADAARGYRFEPAEFDGVPGPIVVETEIHFVLEEVPEPEPEPETAAPVDTTPSRAGDEAQPVSIEGVARERGTRRALSGVIVSIAELGLDAITGEDGRFAFHGVAPGSYRLLAFADEYDRFERSLTLGADEAVDVTLYLRPEGGNPYQTVVEGEREILEVTRRTLRRRQLTTVPGTFGDPIRVIQSLPGLARTPFATGFLLIRGSNPDDSGVFIDGHRVPLLFHFLGGPSILNAEFLDRVDLYPGGFPARYGRSIGGIVSVETRSSESDGIHGSADVDFLDAGGYLRMPLGDKGSLAVAGRRSYLDAFLGAFLPEPDPGEILVVVPVYYDYQARLDYDFGSEGKASLFYLASSDRLDVLSADPEAEEFFDLTSRIDFARLIGRYERPIVGGLRLTLSPAIGFDQVSFAGAPSEDAERFSGVSVDVDNLSYRMRVDGPIGEHVYLDTGIDMESRVTHFELLVPLSEDIRATDAIDITPELLVFNSDAFLYGAYADVAVQLGDLRLIPGVRFDGSLLQGNHLWSIDPRFSARYRLNSAWLAKGYLGLFHQPPQPEALDLEFGNPDLGLERAVHTGVGGEWAFADRWLADLELYFIDRRNLVEFTTDAERDPETGEVDPINYRNSRVGDTIGLELLIKREVTRRLYGWLSYTLSRTRELEFGDDVYEPTPFDQRHGLNAVASYRFDGGWELGGRFRLASGRPITDVVDSTFDADHGHYDRVPGPFRGSRRKTFHQLDARLEKTWLFDTWRLGVYLDVQNLLAVENEEAVQYDYRYRERAPVTSVPFLPTLGVRGSW